MAKRSRRRALGGLLDPVSLPTVALATGGAVALAWFLFRPKDAAAMEAPKARVALPPEVIQRLFRGRVPPPALRRGQPAPAVATSQPRVNDSVPVTAGGATAPMSPSDVVSQADPCYGLTGQAGLDCRADKALAELDSMTR